MRTVLETEYSIDDIFDGQLDLILQSSAIKKLKRYAKSEKFKQADGFAFKPFVAIEQNTGTVLYYREVPLPW